MVQQDSKKLAIDENKNSQNICQNQVAILPLKQIFPLVNLTCSYLRTASFKEWILTKALLLLSFPISRVMAKN